MSYFLLLESIVIGQNIFNYKLHETYSLKECIINIDSVLLDEKATQEDKIIQAFNYSRSAYKSKNLDLAIKYAKIQNNLSQNGNFFPKHFHNSFYLIGKYYMENNQLDSAITFFKKALRLDFYPKKIGQSLGQLGKCYGRQGRLYKSLDYYIKAIDLLISQKNINPSISYTINLSNTCNQLQTKKAADIGIKYIENCLTILKTKNENNYVNEIIYLYNNLGSLYYTEENYSFENSKKNYLKALNLGLKEKNNYSLSVSYNNLGELYLKEKKDSSIFYIKKGINFSKRINNYDKRAIISESYRHLSNHDIYKNKFESSLKNINKSLKHTFDVPLTENLVLNENHFKNAISRRNIVIAFKDKLNILNHLYNKTQKKEYLKKSIITVKLSDAFINYTIQNSTESNTKFLWRDDVSEIYNYGVLAAYNLADNELMHSIIEKNKAFLLTQSIKKNNNQLNLPYQLKTQLKNYKQSILELESKSNQRLMDSIFEIKLSYDRFQDSIKKIYPEYFAKRNDIQPISLKEVKNNLSNNSVLLSYHINAEKNNLFGLFASKEKTIHFKTDLTNNFKSLVDNYKKLISKPLLKKSEFQEFYTISNTLYHKLFPTKESKEFIKNKDLIILSNDILQNIPFESLNTQKDSLKYLIEDHDISYAYSASFLDFNNSLERKTSKNIAAFAPISFQNSNLKPLDATSSEIKAIDNEISTDIFSQTNATKNNFLNTSGDYKILHLATHATSSNNPAIYFSKDTLKLHELYTHKTNADLVVLSACESNLGEIKKGEGVFSLSRGFFYSGTKSVISSLWNVNDVSTADIMKNFYKNLNNHQSKSEALNNAKRIYLKEHSLSEKSPYYWASFVLIGDTSPTYPSPNYLIYILGFIGLFSIILFFFKKRG